MDFDTERNAAGLGARAREAGEAVEEVTEKRFEQFTIDARDFLSARERGGTTGTSIEQASASLADAAEIVNRSFPERGGIGAVHQRHLPGGNLRKAVAVLAVVADRALDLARPVGCLGDRYLGGAAGLRGQPRAGAVRASRVVSPDRPGRL